MRANASAESKLGGEGHECPRAAGYSAMGRGRWEASALRDMEREVDRLRKSYLPSGERSGRVPLAQESTSFPESLREVIFIPTLQLRRERFGSGQFISDSVESVESYPRARRSDPDSFCELNEATAGHRLD